LEEISTMAQLQNVATVHPRSVSTGAVTDRMAFLKKVYAWMTGALVLCAVGAYASVQSGVAARMLGLGLMGHLLVFAGWMGLAFVVQAVRKTPVVNVIAFATYGLFTGLVISDIILVAMLMGDMIAGSTMTYIYQAFGLTAGVFGGLSIYAFFTKQDFSWMRGMLVVGTVALIGLSIVNWFFQATWFSLAVSFGVVLLFSGWVLYNTQKIMREYPMDEHIAASVTLFTDFVVLFVHILRLLLILASDR